MVFGSGVGGSSINSPSFGRAERKADVPDKASSGRLSFTPSGAYIKKLETAVYRLLAKHTSGRKPTF